MDEIEYLPVLMLDEKDRTQEFEEYLKEICEKYSFMPIWYRYQKEGGAGPPRAWWK